MIKDILLFLKMDKLSKKILLVLLPTDSLEKYFLFISKIFYKIDQIGLLSIGDPIKI